MDCVLLDKHCIIKKPTAIALGFFDGVHLGHRNLIKTMNCKAKKKGLESLVVTFNRHPLSVTFPKHSPKLISSNEEKVNVFKNLGVDKVVFLNFDEDMMISKADEFVKDIIVDQLKAELVVIGFNYNFGYRGQGTPLLLKQLGQKYNFDVCVVDPYYIDGQVISSTFIRSLIEMGKVNVVEKYLGKKFSILGKVVKGKGIGRKYGTPTANIELSKDHLTPAPGVYFTQVVHKGVVFRSLTNVGYNPTFKDHPFSIEAYLLDFSDNIYGDKIEIHFVEKIRDEKKFTSIDELFAQIHSDITYIRKKERLHSI